VDTEVLDEILEVLVDEEAEIQEEVQDETLEVVVDEDEVLKVEDKIT
jgi:hypothetical protein